MEKYIRAAQTTDDSTIQYSACAFHAGYLMLQTRTHNMQHFTLPTVQQLPERPSMLRYTYSGSFVCTVIIG